MSEVILQNEVKCKKCGDVIYSAHRHDYVKCSCGACMVDGGMEYLRHNMTPHMEPRFICIDELMYDELEEALEWAEETGRNNRGTICAIFRVLRDHDYLPWQQKQPTLKERIQTWIKNLLQKKK